MKTFLLFAFYFLPWTGCAGLLLYVGRLRAEIRRRIRVNAEATAAVLRNAMVVDSVELPLPSDKQWKTSELTIECTNDKGELKQIRSPALCLGPVAVAGSYLLPYGENGIYVNGSVLKDTPEMIAYAASVWAAQRSRAVREALEKGETS